MLGIVLGIWSILVNITRIFTLLELKWQVSVYHMCCATYIYDLCHIMFIACILLETYEYLKSFSSLQAVGDQRMMGSSSFWFRRKQNQEYTFRRNKHCMYGGYSHSGMSPSASISQVHTMSYLLCSTLFLQKKIFCISDN